MSQDLFDVVDEYGDLAYFAKQLNVVDQDDRDDVLNVIDLDNLDAAQLEKTMELLSRNGDIEFLRTTDGNTAVSYHPPNKKLEYIKPFRRVQLSHSSHDDMADMVMNDMLRRAVNVGCECHKTNYNTWSCSFYVLSRTDLNGKNCKSENRIFNVSMTTFTKKYDDIWFKFIRTPSFQWLISTYDATFSLLNANESNSEYDEEHEKYDNKNSENNECDLPEYIKFARVVPATYHGSDNSTTSSSENKEDKNKEDNGEYSYEYEYEDDNKSKNDSENNSNENNDSEEIREETVVAGQKRPNQSRADSETVSEADDVIDRDNVASDVSDGEEQGKKRSKLNQANYRNNYSIYV